MFEEEILRLGFQASLNNDEQQKNGKINSYSLQVDISLEYPITFLYIKHGGTFYYEYYSKNYHRESNRERFIELIYEAKSLKRDSIIDTILF